MCFNRLFQYFHFNYTPDWTIWSSKFPKNSGRSLPKLLPRPSSTLSWASPSIRTAGCAAAPSNIERFAPLIGTSSDTDPPNFDAWLRPWAQTINLLTVGEDEIRRYATISMSSSHCWMQIQWNHRLEYTCTSFTLDSTHYPASGGEPMAGVSKVARETILRGTSRLRNSQWNNGWI